MNKDNQPPPAGHEVSGAVPGTTPGTILIVDDNPNNLRVLGGMLEQAGYKVRPALNGELALRSCGSSLPDLVLLDIRMPGMDGYEVCRRLKVEPASRDVPVIFISALQETEDKVNAFRAGGVDYVVKPFQLEEVLARVNTHVSLRRAQERLQQAYAEVEERVRERTRELEASNQRIARQTRVEQTLGEILRLSLSPADMDGFLDGVLDILASSAPWNNPWRKSAVFLTDSRGAEPRLRLAASKNFSTAQRQACSVVPFDACFCGQAAERMELVFSDETQEHEIFYEGQRPHGHVAVPIVQGKQVLGVLVNYREPGQPRSQEQEAFLVRVADTLGAGIARRYAEDRIEYLAYHDDLTQLPNRRLLTDRITQELFVAQRRRTSGALLFLDLDLFKKVNDALGHEVGDTLLREAARRVGSQLRSEDTVAHWGADEFVVMLPALGTDTHSAAQNAHGVAEKLRQALARPFEIEQHELQLTASIGIALFPADGSHSEELLSHADSAMFQAKQKGRNGVRFYQPGFQSAAEARLSLEKDLRHALDNSELSLFYQPQCDREGRVVGAEALVRWQHPTRGMVSPGDFIPVAEETGMILRLGHWVLNEACRQVRAWSDRGLLSGGFGRVAINVSAKQFYERDFVGQVEMALAQSGADPRRLEIEVTESMLLVGVETTVTTMNRLKALGVTFSIDDFGTGYSSLSYLRRLPVDKLKIDRSFVNGVCRDTQDAAIVETILSMAGHLHLQTVAEGVENERELAFLADKGCSIYQGFYFARPMPTPGVEQRLEGQRDAEAS